MDSFAQTLSRDLAVAGHTVDAAGKVSLSLEDLAAFVSKRNLHVVSMFTRLQRKAGIQTVHYCDVAHPDSFTVMASRMVEHDVIRPAESASAVAMLSEQVINIRPLMDDQLFSVCNGHVDARSISALKS